MAQGPYKQSKATFIPVLLYSMILERQIKGPCPSIIHPTLFKYQSW